jgi:hypothetical protein
MWTQNPTRFVQAAIVVTRSRIVAGPGSKTFFCYRSTSGTCCAWRANDTSDKQKRRVPKGSAAFVIVTRKEEFLVLGRPGSDLLSQGLSHSTIGAEEFNGRVRDGIGFMLLARTTRPAKDKENEASDL